MSTTCKQILNFLSMSSLFFLTTLTIKAADTQEIYDYSLEELMNLKITVSTVSKRNEKLSESPGIVSVLTEEEIKAYGAKNLFDLMNKAPSMQPVGSHLFRQNKMSIRGDLKDHSDNHMLILLNGRPMREGVNTGQNFSVYMAFPTDIIKRVEIIRGPGSVLYGTNAFAGVINIITKSVEDIKASSVSYGVGTNSTNIQKLQTAFSEEEFQMVLSGFRLESTGWNFNASTAHPNPALPVLSDNNDYAEEAFGLFTNIKWHGLQLNAFYSEVNHDMLGIAPYWSGADDNITRRGFVDLGYLFEINDSWELQTNLTFNYYDLKVGSSDHLATDILYEASLHGQLSENIHLILGGLVDNRRRNKDLENSSIPGTYSLYNSAVYGQIDYTPIDNLKLTAGGQYIIPDKIDADFVPRFGLVYNFDESWGFKLLHSDAFRSAGTVEQFIDSPFVQGNPNLTPEKIQTTDMQIFYEKEEQSYYLSAFYSEYTDMIARATIPSSPGRVRFENRDESTRVKGLEFEFKYHFSEQWFTSGSAMYQETENDFMKAPNHMFKLGVIYKPTQKISFGLFDSYYGKPQKNDGEEVNSAADDIHFVTLNMTYQLPTKKDIELNLYLQNLLDEDYDYVEFSRGWSNTLPLLDGINAYLTLTVKF